VSSGTGCHSHWLRDSVPATIIHQHQLMTGYASLPPLRFNAQFSRWTWLSHLPMVIFHLFQCRWEPFWIIDTVFHGPVVLPVTQSTASKHWRTLLTAKQGTAPHWLIFSSSTNGLLGNESCLHDGILCADIVGSLNWRHFSLYRPTRERCLWERSFKRHFIHWMKWRRSNLQSLCCGATRHTMWS